MKSYTACAEKENKGTLKQSRLRQGPELVRSVYILKCSGTGSQTKRQVGGVVCQHGQNQGDWSHSNRRASCADIRCFGSKRKNGRRNSETRSACSRSYRYFCDSTSTRGQWLILEAGTLRRVTPIHHRENLGTRLKASQLTIRAENFLAVIARERKLGVHGSQELNHLTDVVIVARPRAWSLGRFEQDVRGQQFEELAPYFVN